VSLGSRAFDANMVVSRDIEVATMGADFLMNHDFNWHMNEGKLFIDGQEIKLHAKSEQRVCRQVVCQRPQNDEGEVPLQQGLQSRSLKKRRPRRRRTKKCGQDTNDHAGVGEPVEKIGPRNTMQRIAAKLNVDESVEMSKAQRGDVDIGPIYEALLQSTEKPDVRQFSHCSKATMSLLDQWPKLVMLEHVVYRKWLDRRTNETTRLQCLIPVSARHEALTRAHIGLTGNHCGFHSTAMRLQRRCYWRTWRQDIAHFVNTQCSDCSVHKWNKPLLTDSENDRRLGGVITKSQLLLQTESQQPIATRLDVSLPKSGKEESGWRLQRAAERPTCLRFYVSVDMKFGVHTS